MNPNSKFSTHISKSVLTYVGYVRVCLTEANFSSYVRTYVVHLKNISAIQDMHVLDQFSEYQRIHPM